MRHPPRYTRTDTLFPYTTLFRSRGAPIFPARLPRNDAELVEFVRAKAETVYHPVGTCRMGSDDAAVVDPQLRVRGIEGLRVVDASVMPTLPTGNTNAQTIMIAERAADLISSGWSTTSVTERWVELGRDTRRARVRRYG